MSSTGTFPTVVSSAIKPFVVGTAVSLSATGSAQIGGGTTIYRNVGTIPPDACPKFLAATPVFDDKFLVSYSDGKAGRGYLYVMSVNSTRKATVVASNISLYDLYHVVTLDQGTGLFVSISQDDTYGQPNTAVIAGRSNKNNGYAITFGAKMVYTSNFSVDPSITVLSNTTFAIAYYYGQEVWAKFGMPLHYFSNICISFIISDPTLSL